MLNKTERLLHRWAPEGWVVCLAHRNYKGLFDGCVDVCGWVYVRVYVCMHAWLYVWAD